MMIIRIIIFLIFILLGFATPSHAFLGSAIAAGAAWLLSLGGVTLGAAAASAIVTGVNVLAVSALASFIGGSPEQSTDIGAGSPTYGDDLPQATMTKGTPIPEGFGMDRIAGNIVRPDDVKNQNWIKFIVAYGKGEFDEFLGHYINDVEWTDLKGNHSKWEHLGTDTQTGVTNIFDDAETCNFRTIAIVEHKLATGSEIRSLNNANAVVKLEKCLEIGEDAGGVESWTNNPAQIGWHWYITRKRKTAAELNEDAFTALELYCANVSTDSQPCIMRPPIVSNDTVKATTEYGADFKAKYAMRSGKSLVSGALLNSWVSTNGSTTDQRINFDLGRDDLVPVGIYIDNYHDSGLNSDYGIQNFIFQGSNSAASHADTSYASTGWSNIQSGLAADQHTAADQADTQFISITNTTAYRYLALKIADNYGGSYMGLRNIKILCLTPRYTFNMIFDAKIEKNDAEKIIWNSFNGRIIRSQGKYKPVWSGAQEHDDAGGLQTKSVKHVFTKDNIIGGKIQWQRLSRPNFVRIYYINSADDFKRDPVELRDKQDIDARGEVLYEENCLWIKDTALATRYCERLFNERYLEWSGWIPGFPDSQKLEVYDRVQVTHDLPEWSSKDFIIKDIDKDWLGRPLFYVEEYLSGLYRDEGFEIQPGYPSQAINPNLPPVSTGAVSATFNSVGSASYSSGSISITFTPPSNPSYSHTQALVSTDDSNYYPAPETSSNGTIYVNGMGLFYAPGDTVYIKLQHFNVNSIASVIPASYDDSVVIPDDVALVRFANWYFGLNDIWGGNAAIDNAGTLAVLGGLNSLPFFALGASANAMTISNMSSYPGFYADGYGYFRAGGANKYLLWDGDIYIQAGANFYLDSATETMVIGSVAADGISFDTTNGQRMYDGGVLKGQWALDSTWWLGPATTNRKVEWNPTNDTFYVRGNAAFDTLVWQEVLTTKGTIFVAISGGDLFEGTTATATTFTIKITKSPSGAAPFTSGDRCFIDNGINSTWFSVGAGSDQTTYWQYTATYRSGSNSASYAVGTAITDFGASGQGFIRLTSDMSNAPYLEMATHAGSPWSVITTHLRLGNLNGSYGYSSEIYGIGLGEFSQTMYMTIDSTNGIRFLNVSDVVYGSILSNIWTIGRSTHDHIEITTTAVNIKDGATVWTSIGAGVITIGRVAASQNNILISSGAIYLRNNTTNVIAISNIGVPTITMPNNGVINFGSHSLSSDGSGLVCSGDFIAYGNIVADNITRGNYAIDVDGVDYGLTATEILSIDVDYLDDDILYIWAKLSVTVDPILNDGKSGGFYVSSQVSIRKDNTTGELIDSAFVMYTPTVNLNTPVTATLFGMIQTSGSGTQTIVICAKAYQPAAYTLNTVGTIGYSKIGVLAVSR